MTAPLSHQCPTCRGNGSLRGECGLPITRSTGRCERGHSSLAPTCPGPGDYAECSTCAGCGRVVPLSMVREVAAAMVDDALDRVG